MDLRIFLLVLFIVLTTASVPASSTTSYEASGCRVKKPVRLTKRTLKCIFHCPNTETHGCKEGFFPIIIKININKSEYAVLKTVDPTACRLDQCRCHLIINGLRDKGISSSIVQKFERKLICPKDKSGAAALDLYQNLPMFGSAQTLENIEFE